MRTTPLTALGALALLGCVACPSAAAADPQAKVKIVFAAGFNYDRFYNQMIPLFEQEHPNIEVEFWAIDDSAQLITKLLTEHAAGVYTDVLPLMPPLLHQPNQDFYLPLDAYLQRDGDQMNVGDFIPAAMQGNQYQGRQYGLPFWGDLWGIAHYQPSLFAEAGVTPLAQSAQAGDWSFDTLYAAAKKLTKVGPDGTLTQVGLNTTMGTANEFSSWFWAYGGRFFDETGRKTLIDSKASIDALTTVQSLLKQGVINIDSLWKSHKVAIQVWNVSAAGLDSTWGKGNYDYVPLPPGPVAADDIAFSISGYGIDKHSKHPEEAWELIKFLTGPEAEKIYVQAPAGGGLPARTSDLSVWTASRAAYGATAGPLLGEAFSRVQPFPRTQAADLKAFQTLNTEVVTPLTRGDAAPAVIAAKAAAMINSEP